MLVTFLVFAAVAVLALVALATYLVPGAKKMSTVPGMEPSDER